MKLFNIAAFLLFSSVGATATTIGTSDYEKLQVCPSDNLPSDGVWKLAPHQLTVQSVEGCVLSCHTRESCAAASMIAQVCLLASAEAFLTAWLYGGQCETFVNRQRLRRFQDSHISDLPSSISLSSLRILYHFRVGPFNLAPVRRNPLTPVLASARLDKSQGVVLNDAAGSFIDVNTADGIEDLFVPVPFVTVLLRTKYEYNTDDASQNIFLRIFKCGTNQDGVTIFLKKMGSIVYRLAAPAGLKFQSYASPFLTNSGGDFAGLGFFANQSELYHYDRGNLNQLSFAEFSAGFARTEVNYQCVRVGGLAFNSSQNMKCLIECLAVVQGQLSKHQLDQLDSWCSSKAAVPH